MRKSRTQIHKSTGNVVEDGCSEAVRVEYRTKASVRGVVLGAGFVVGRPEVMRRAFRIGVVRLSLDEGVDLDVRVIAHSEGSEKAYFEILRCNRRVPTMAARPASDQAPHLGS